MGDLVELSWTEGGRVRRVSGWVQESSDPAFSAFFQTLNFQHKLDCVRLSCERACIRLQKQLLYRCIER